MVHPWLQVLSPQFLSQYGRDIINIHHGLLPSFKGARPYLQAYHAGVKLIGATSHFVTPQLDEGPIIEQMVCLTSLHCTGLYCTVLSRQNSSVSGRRRASHCPRYQARTSESSSALLAALSQSGALRSAVLCNMCSQVDRVSHRDTLASLAIKSKLVEQQCLSQAVQYYAEHRILRFSNNKTIVFAS